MASMWSNTIAGRSAWLHCQKTALLVGHHGLMIEEQPIAAQIIASASPSWLWCLLEGSFEYVQLFGFDGGPRAAPFTYTQDLYTGCSGKIVFIIHCNSSLAYISLQEIFNTMRVVHSYSYWLAMLSAQIIIQWSPKWPIPSPLTCPPYLQCPRLVTCSRLPCRPRPPRTPTRESLRPLKKYLTNSLFQNVFPTVCSKIFYQQFVPKCFSNSLFQKKSKIVVDNICIGLLPTIF